MRTTHVGKKKISIYDIARELKISASTVPRALRNRPAISTEVKENVQKLAQEMNFKPNQMEQCRSIHWTVKEKVVRLYP